MLPKKSKSNTNEKRTNLINEILELVSTELCGLHSQHKADAIHKIGFSCKGVEAVGLTQLQKKKTEIFADLHHSAQSRP
jgi:hypothetical protein